MSEEILMLQKEIALSCMQMGISGGISVDLSQMIVSRIKRRFKGDVFYFPKSEKKERDKRIINMFSGNNHGEVCSFFCISRRTLYRVLAR